MSNQPVIVATGLAKDFEGIDAVKNLSLSVDAGQVVALLGPNGAGKTTTVNMLATLLPIDRGSAAIGGFDVAGKPGRVRQLIGFAGQSAAVDEKLTARENLTLFARLYKLPRDIRRSRVAELIEKFDMEDFADRVVETYSGGQKRRLDVVAALVADPPAIFLDEPTTGLDPRSRSEVWDTISSLAARGTAVLLTTQYLDEADRLADNVIIIDHGTIIAEGTPATLKRDLQRDVLEIHLKPDDLPRARTLVGSAKEVMTDRDAGTIRIPVGDNIALALDLLRRFEDGGVSILDFQLRRPTLDDVFLSLTGSPAFEEVSA